MSRVIIRGQAKKTERKKGNPVYPGVDKSIGHFMLLFRAVKAMLTSASPSDVDVLRREILALHQKMSRSMDGCPNPRFSRVQKRGAGHGSRSLLVRKERTPDFP